MLLQGTVHAATVAWPPRNHHMHRPWPVQYESSKKEKKGEEIYAGSENIALPT